MGVLYIRRSCCNFLLCPNLIPMVQMPCMLVPHRACCSRPLSWWDMHVTTPSLIRVFGCTCAKLNVLFYDSNFHIEADTCTSLIHQPSFRLDGRVGLLMSRMRHLGFLPNTTGYKAEEW